MKQGKVYIYGKHAVSEALQHAPHVVKKVYLAHDLNDQELKALLRHNSIPTATMNPKDSKKLVGGSAAHQGVIGVMDVTQLMIPLNTFLETLRSDPDTVLVLLDELQDPHNVGAIIRSAAAFGASGILMPQNNQAPITGAVVKTSAGMVFQVPMVSIGNVNAAVRLLKEQGFWVYGLAMEGDHDLAKETFDAPTLFVIGNEAEGIRRKTLDLCDVALRIPMREQAESLNAAVSAAVVLYQWSMQHPSSSR